MQRAKTHAHWPHEALQKNFGEVLPDIGLTVKKSCDLNHTCKVIFIYIFVIFNGYSTRNDFK